MRFGWMGLALLAACSTQDGGPARASRARVGMDTAAPICLPRRLVSVTSERQVNVATEDAQHHATLDVDALGRVLYAYNEGSQGHRVAARLFTSDGDDLTGERHLSPEDEPASHPQVLHLGDRFLVGWHTLDGAGVRLRTMNPDRGTVSAVVHAYDRPMGLCEYVDLVGDPASMWIMAAWLGTDPVIGKRLVTRTFDRGLVPVGPARTMPSATGMDADGPIALTISTAGEVLLAWVEAGATASTVLVARVDVAGGLLAPPIEVAWGRPGFGRPELAALPDGGFAIAWRLGAAQGNGQGAWLGMFDAVGTPTLDPVQLDATGSGEHPTLLVVGEELIVAWDEDHGGGALSDVFAQVWSLDGVPRSEPRLVNGQRGEAQTRPALAAMAGPGAPVTVSWESFGQDGDQRGVYTRQFAVEDASCP